MPGGNSDLMFFRCPAYLPVVWLQKEEVSSQPWKPKTKRGRQLQRQIRKRFRQLQSINWPPWWRKLNPSTRILPLNPHLTKSLDERQTEGPQHSNLLLWIRECLGFRYPPACGSYQSTDGEYELLETDNVGSAPTTRHALDLSEVRANETERNRTSDGLSTADRTLYDLSKQYLSSLSLRLSSLNSADG